MSDPVSLPVLGLARRLYCHENALGVGGDKALGAGGLGWVPRVGWPGRSVMGGVGGVGGSAVSGDEAWASAWRWSECFVWYWGDLDRVRLGRVVRSVAMSVC